MTAKQQREIASKGGKASQKKRAERKKFKEDLITALEAMQDGKTLQEIGIEAIVKKFMDGDIKAFEVVRDTIGEKPVEKLEAEVKETTITVALEDE